MKPLDEASALPPEYPGWMVEFQNRAIRAASARMPTEAEIPRGRRTPEVDSVSPTRRLGVSHGLPVLKARKKDVPFGGGAGDRLRDTAHRGACRPRAEGHVRRSRCASTVQDRRGEIGGGGGLAGDDAGAHAGTDEDQQGHDGIDRAVEVGLRVVNRRAAGAGDDDERVGQARGDVGDLL